MQPQGVVVDRAWPSAAGYSSLRADLTILDVQPFTPYFWAHQFGIQRGSGGYIGLQSNGNRSKGTPGKSALFSIWDADAVTGPADGECGTFGGEGEGYHCIDDFDWQLGRTYTLRISPGSEDGQPGRWWSGWVLDTVTGADTWLGSIHVPWAGQLGASSGTWTEYFGSLDACADQPYSSVRWGSLVADNGDRPVNKLTYYNGNPANELCPNGRMTAEPGGAVLQEAGGAVQRPEPEQVRSINVHLRAGVMRSTGPARGRRSRSLTMRVHYDAVQWPIVLKSRLTGPGGYLRQLLPIRTVADGPGRLMVIYRATVRRPGTYTIRTMLAASENVAAATVTRSLRVR